MKILIVDNYGVPNSESVRHLKKVMDECSKQKCAVIRFDDPALPRRGRRYDAIILSGSGELLSRGLSAEKYQAEFDLIKNSSASILGICFGHQLIGIAYGSRVVSLGRLIKGFFEVKIVRLNSIFSDLPETVIVYESHREALEKIPKDFVLIASSKDSAVEAMRHRKRL